MDPDKKPLSTEPGAHAGGDLDESQAADILNAAASKPADAAPVAPADAAAPAAATPAFDASSDAVSPANTPAPAVSPSVPSPTAPTPSASPVPDSPSPNLANGSGVLGAAPGGMVTPKKPKKGMLIGSIIGIVVIVLLGGGAAAYYQVMNKPQNVLGMALENSLSPTEAGSVDYEGTLDIKPKDSNTYSTAFTGSSDVNTGAFNLNAKVDAMVTTVNVDMRSSDGKTFYMRVGGLDGISSMLGMTGMSDTTDPAAADEMSLVEPIISAVNNQWIQVNQSMIQQLTGSKDEVTSKLSTDDLKKISDAYKKNQFLTVSKTFKDETIKGKASKHYQVTVDKTKLKNFVNAVKAANISSFKSLASDDVKDLLKQVDNVDFSKYPVDVWISKSDHMFQQVDFTASTDGTNVHVRYTVDDYNKPVQVTVPSNAKSLLDILSGALGGSATGADSSAMDSLTDGSGISL